MNKHSVKFIRGSKTIWDQLNTTPEKIDNNTLYFIYEDENYSVGKLYLGQRLITDDKIINIKDIGDIQIDNESLIDKQILIYNEENQEWKNSSLEEIIDLSNYYTKNEVDNNISTKMALTPFNPTAEEITAMSDGQLYGDTINHKGIVKDGQSFYDTVYIDENYRKTYISSLYRPPIITLGTTPKFSEGDKWVFNVSDYANRCSYTLINHDIDPVKDCVYYYWKSDTNAYRVGNYMPITQMFTQRIIEGETWYETPSISVGDVVIRKTDNKITAYYVCINTYFTYNKDGYETEYMEISVPENYYTKTETNTLLADKMDLTPLNPTAQEIEDMPDGQLYGDENNHKGVIKGGQEFYDTTVAVRVFENNDGQSPPLRTITDDARYHRGDIWINLSYQGSERVCTALYICKSVWMPGNFNWQYRWLCLYGANSEYYTKTEIDQKGYLTLDTLPIYDGTVI